MLYGFGEGPWHGKQFKKRLAGTDFEIVTDPNEADTVIAHSAGCFYTPQLREAQTIMLIGPTYWPGRNPNVQWLQKIWIDFRLNIFCHPLFLLRKTGWNIIYLVRDISRARQIIKLAKRFSITEVITHHKSIIVRNKHDTWLKPDLDELKKYNASLRIHHVAGEHDDCWLHPDIYVNLLQSDV